MTGRTIQAITPFDKTERINMIGYLINNTSQYLTLDSFQHRFGRFYEPHALGFLLLQNVVIVIDRWFAVFFMSPMDICQVIEPGDRQEKPRCKCVYCCHLWHIQIRECGNWCHDR